MVDALLWLCAVATTGATWAALALILDLLANRR